MKRSSRAAVPSASTAETHDRTLLRQAQESEQRWRSVAENPFDFVVIVDRNGTFEYINRTAFGLRMEDLIGQKTMFDFITAADVGAARAALDSVFATGKAAYYESYSPQPVDGWYGCVVGAIEHDGKVVSASILSRDITQQKKAEMALRESEERFRQLAETIQDVFYLFDPVNRQTLYLSPAYESIWGEPREAVEHDGDVPTRAIHPEDRDRVCAEFEPSIENADQPSIAEYRIIRPDGEIRWLRHRRFVTPKAEDGGRIAGVVTDITEQREAQKQLQEAEAKYRMLIEKLPIITYITSPETSPSTLYISPQIESKLGFKPEEWTADPELWARQIHPGDRGRWLRAQARFRSTGEPLRIEYRLLSTDGEIHWFRDEAVLVRRDGEAPLIQGIMLDVTEVEQARVGQEAARRLSSSLVDVQEAERRRIARELHDEVGQVLTGLKLLLEVRSGDAAQRRLDEAAQVVNELLSKVRDLSLDLRPAMLDDLGLLPAWVWMFERYTKQTGIQVRFEHRGIEERCQPSEETAAYRVVQEALTNVARHANVREVRVRTWGDTKTLNVQVEDLGSGFDVDMVMQDHSKSGLVGMRERVMLLGGDLEIESSPGRGTRMTAHLPIHPLEREDDGTPSPGR